MGNDEYDLDDLCNDADDAISDLVAFARKAEERGYNRGTEEAFDMYRKEPLDEHKIKLLQDRYHYLRHGGEWQRELLPSDEFASPADNYAAGFLDAMKVLRVKP